MMDTIFALASAKGRAGVAVVRLSGPNAARGALALCGTVPVSRGLRTLSFDGDVLDQALVLHFPKGKSFTGEEVIEFHLHGSQAVVTAVLRALDAQPDLRHAEAGEFTRRALENGCLDLAQVEGLADLIDAETEVQRQQAMRVFQGSLGYLVDDLRKDLLRAAALVEATIDFVDEDVPIDVFPEVEALLTKVRGILLQQAEGVGAAERIRDGFEIAIVGLPNAGKSTLLNALAGRDAAITSEVAGTTRDVIEVRMDIAGYAVTVLDTAGIRDTDDQVEKLGVDLAKKRADGADLRIHLLDGGGNTGLIVRPDDIVVHGKSDLGAVDGLGVSGHTGDGINELIQLISGKLGVLLASAGIAVRERHRVAMLKAIDSIDAARLLVQSGSHDLVAEEIRTANRAIDMIVGRIDVEDLLGEIFSSFCIGK